MMRNRFLFSLLLLRRTPLAGNLAEPRSGDSRREIELRTGGEIGGGGGGDGGGGGGGVFTDLGSRSPRETTTSTEIFRKLK